MSNRLASCSCGQLTAQVKGEPVQSLFVTAWPANAEPAAPSRSKPGFLARMSRSRVFQLNTSAWVTKAREHGFTSAHLRIAYSGPCRPLIPEHAGPPFRSMPGHDSGACRHRV